MGGDRKDEHGHNLIQPFSRAVRFHGHVCPGLAIGYYASNIAMRWLYSENMTGDEVVAMVESAGCPADAVQVITGCTTGKKSLIVHDYGKHVYTFALRGRAKGIRISLKPGFSVDVLDPGLAGLREKIASGAGTSGDDHELRKRIEAVCRTILESPGEEVFEIKAVAIDLPEREPGSAVIACDRCGEPVSLEKAVRHGENYVCQPCLHPR